MRSPFPRGWVWVGDDPAAVERARDTYPIGHVLEASLEASPAPSPAARFAAVFSGTQFASGASYIVRIGAAWVPAADGRLRIEVGVAAEPNGLDDELAGAVLAGARTVEAPPAGLLRFDRALVHPVDCKVAMYRRAGRVLAGLLADPPPDERALEVRAAELWRDAARSS